MGFLLHHTIVVTSWDKKENFKTVRSEAVKLFTGARVSSLVGPLTNGQMSFFVAPDGSKEGWGESLECDSFREKFVAYLRSCSCQVDWVEIRFGGDEGENLTKILAHDDDAFSQREV